MANRIEFTGECFVPGKSESRIEADHMARYRFACRLARNKAVLDIACGAGYAAPMLLEAGAARYTGVDLNPDVIAFAAAAYGSDRAAFTVGDIRTFVPERPYDLVTCFETIEHVRDYRAALQNLFRLLRPEGILLISSPHRSITSPLARSLSDPPRNRFHTQEFLPAELASELLAAGFLLGPDSLYGQRQRRYFANPLLRKAARLIFGNPDRKASADVTPVNDRTPRYFLYVAQKPRGSES